VADVVNPFRYGALALDEAFTDREGEIAELKADVESGQDVVIFAPRRYGKSSLMWRVAQELVENDVLVAHVDLMTTPTPAQLAAKLARTIHDDIASRLFRARQRVRAFQGLRIRPTVTVNPDTGALGFTFDASGAAPEDVHQTLEELLALPGRLGAERDRKVCLVLDEFQEILDIDRSLPRLMRSVFQAQPDVAHVYLGSRRHLMQSVFSDENEPFWRSAKRMELDVIEPEHFAGFIAERFAGTGRTIDADAVDAVLRETGGHPYATQELCYFTWAETAPGGAADAATVEAALDRVLRSEHAHFTLVWERAPTAQRRVLQALARERGRPLTEAYRRRHALPGATAVQRALGYLERAELVARRRGEAWISEPFLAAWLRRIDA
jgi:AAA+ ATPase superfamily predicted ATPase